MALRNKTPDRERAAVSQRLANHRKNILGGHERMTHPLDGLNRARSGSASSLRPADVLSLQRTVGNRAVQRMLSGTRVASGVRTSASVNIIQRQPNDRERILGDELSGLYVRRDAPAPAALSAVPYRQGSEVHLPAANETHLSQEAWNPSPSRNAARAQSSGTVAATTSADGPVRSRAAQSSSAYAAPDLSQPAAGPQQQSQEPQPQPSNLTDERDETSAYSISSAYTVQTKLAVGPAGDHYEKEADRVAAQVMQTVAPAPPRIQRQPEETEEAARPIQTKPLAASITPLVQREELPETVDEHLRSVQRQGDHSSAAVGAEVEPGILRARGSGEALPDGLRTRMERSFGADFAGVRVHADPAADGLNRSLQARAFTTGRDLFFRAGEYDPQSRQGQYLIAHELTHVVQQTGAKAPTGDLRVQRAPLDELRGFFNADPIGKFGNKITPQGSERRENYNRDLKTDLARYLMIAIGSGASAAKAITDRAAVLSDKPGFLDGVSAFFTRSTPVVSETGKVLGQMGAVSGVMGAATSLADSYKGFKQAADSAVTGRQRAFGFAQGVSGLSSATQQSAATAFNIANIMLDPAVATTAQVVSGWAGAVTGAVDILRGHYARKKAKQNIARLERLKESNNPDIRSAAIQAQSTQQMRKDHAKWTKRKGVLGFVGGALLAASVATPVGWLLLGLGAIVGGVSVIARYFKKRARKEEVAVRELNIEAEREIWKRDVEKVKKETWWGSSERKRRMEEAGRDPLEQALEDSGFVSVGHFYANYINYTATAIRDAGIAGRKRLVDDILQGQRTLARKQQMSWRLKEMSYKDIKKQLNLEAQHGNPYPEVEELLAGMGLKFDWRKTPVEPSAEKIGKALHE